MNSASESDRWLVCPVCHKPNPPRRWFCQHCWGAVLHPDISVSSRELEEVAKHRQAYLRRKKTIKAVTISLISSISLALAVYLGLYYFTDIVSPPPQEINSDFPTGEWAMFRRDLAHSGSTDSGEVLPQGTVKWTFPTGGAIHSSPAVAYDTVYFGSRDNKFYAVDEATGTKRWEFETDSWVESSPAVVNGVVYFGSNDGNLYALNAYSGQKLWDFKIGYALSSSPAVANGVVYFGGEDYYLYALNAITGRTLWDFKTEGSVKSSPVVAQGIVYIGSGSAFSYALDARNGRLRLRFQTYRPVFSSPAVSDGTIYFTDSDGFLHVVDGKARTWFQEHGIKPIWLQLYLLGVPGIPEPPPQSGSLWRLKIGKKVSSSPTITGDTLYVGSDNKIVAIDLQSRQKRWEFGTEGAVRSSPAVVDSIVYVGSEDGRLYAVEANTGERLWDVPTSDMITSSPAVVGGIIYVGSHDGKLYAIR